MGAVVTQSVPAGKAVSGNFARDHGLLINQMKDMIAEISE